MAQSIGFHSPEIADRCAVEYPASNQRKPWHFILLLRAVGAFNRQACRILLSQREAWCYSVYTLIYVHPI